MSRRVNRRLNVGAIRSFTLIELMIVIAIIAIIAGIAIPALWSALATSNEGSAIGALKAISSGNAMYKTKYRIFAGSLGDLNAVGIIDHSVASGTINQYVLTYTGGQASFTCYATPESDTAGTRSFYLDQNGIIKQTDGISSSGGTGWSQISD